MRPVPLFLCASLAPLVTAPLAAQQAHPVRVFLDCQNLFCDFDHFRRSIAFVDWVRDRQDADVHVLATAQPTGGGREYTFTFLGLRRFQGQADTLRHASSRTDTDAEVREGQTRVLSLGLVRFAARTPFAERLSVAYRAPEGAAATRAAADDPWNLWVFRAFLSVEVEGESRQDQQEYETRLTAQRVTEGVKLGLALGGEYRREAFELDDTTKFVSTSRDWETEGFVVWSLGPHWSFGIQSEVGASTFFNRDFRIEGGPTLEFNVFPYAESTRRLLTVSLTPALTYYDYEQETIFDRTSELRPAHLVEMGLAQQEPWGELHGSLGWWQYWHDWSRHRLELFAGVEIRLLRGLSFNLFGQVARVKDQIYLPKEDLPPEEILLRRRQLGTDFRYSIDVGLSYTFGSIFNNVVNPRIRH